MVGRGHTGTIHFWRDTAYQGTREGSRVYWYSYCGISTHTKPEPVEGRGEEVEGTRCKWCECCTDDRRADPSDPTMGHTSATEIEAECQARRDAYKKSRKARKRPRKDPCARTKEQAMWELDLIYDDP